MSFETKTFVSVLIIVIYLIQFFITLVEDRIAGKTRILSALLMCLLLHTFVNACSDYFDYTHSSVTGQYILCTLYPFIGYLSLFLYGKYYIQTCESSDRIKHIIKIVNIVILALNMLCIVVLVPTRMLFYVTEDGIYNRGPMFFFSYLFVFMEMLMLSVLAFFIIPNNKKAAGHFIYGILPIFASALMAFSSVPSNLNDVATMLATIIMFSFVFIEDKRRNLENEAKLVQYKTDVMLSQISPHFVYNTLSTIAALCTMDPQRAQGLTENFSDYLRTDLSLAKSNQLSPFDMELKHTRKYLEIEKVRFGEHLKIEYDIQITDFVLPSLTLQPIVENAVRHGVTKKPNGGTVRIVTEKRENEIAVIVSDDGVGCTPADLEPKEGHYGLSAARDRVAMLLGGNLKVESIVGQGTTVTIILKALEETK